MAYWRHVVKKLLLLFFVHRRKAVGCDSHNMYLKLTILNLSENEYISIKKIIVKMRVNVSHNNIERNMHFWEYLNIFCGARTLLTADVLMIVVPFTLHFGDVVVRRVEAEGRGMGDRNSSNAWGMGVTELLHNISMAVRAKKSRLSQ